MEQLAIKLAKKISSTLNYDHEKEEIIAYGMIAIIQAVVTFSLIIILGFIFGIWIESLTVVLTASILRKYSGGSHADSIEICTVTAIIYSISCSLLLKYIIVPHINFELSAVISGIVFLWGFWIILKRAPVDSPNKPIKTEAKIKKMRTYSFAIMGAYFTINAIFLFLTNKNAFYFNLSFSLLFGILWQISTLTKTSSILAKKISFRHFE